MKEYFLASCWVFMSFFAFSNVADLNDDKKVDMQDFAIFSKAWRTQEGQEAFDSACDISEPADQVIDVNDLITFAINWNARTITFDVYSDGWGHYCDTVEIEEEGIWTIEFTDPEDPYGLDPTHYAYAYRDMYYTEIYNISAVEIPSPPFPPTSEYNYTATIEIDLDSIDPNKFNGTIFLTQTFFSDAYLSEQLVKVYSSGPNSGLVYEFTTDNQGRFAIDLEPGFYWIEFYEYPSDPYTLHEHEFVVSKDYQDFYFPASYQAFKPNIYLCPEVTTELMVQVTFPHGGEITESEPFYKDGWQISVEPSGLIDGRYSYLYYESKQPDFGQYATGWIIAQSDLEIFFRNNLTATGFNATEIEDFIDYWVPLLDYSPYYAIYPQYNEQIEKMIQISFSQQPDNIIRLIYSIRGIQNNSLVLAEPQIPEFCRDGFTVAEWGVILK